MEIMWFVCFLLFNFDQHLILFMLPEKCHKNVCMFILSVTFHIIFVCWTYEDI